MIRTVYRSLLSLHPSQFKEQFADEMLWIFDESDANEHFSLLNDVVISLLRQWGLRSRIWKFGIGAVASGLLMSSCAYSLQTAFANALRRGNPGHFAEAKLRTLNLGASPQAGVGAPSPTGAETTHEELIWPIELGPPIAALKQHLSSGQNDTVETFWREIAKTGTPLVSPAKDKPHAVIATFVWHGDRNTENVGLLAPLANSPSLPNQPLAHLSGTDVWYASWELRDDLRFTYRFTVNLKPGQNVQQLAVLDPLNPQKMAVSFEGGRIPATQLSIASMPHAPEERWAIAHPGVPSGHVATQMLKSPTVGSERQIWVYTPPGYKETGPSGYALLVLFDGFSYQHWVPAPTILDNLAYAKKCPPVVAVLIDNPPETRSSDLEYNLAFTKWLGDEMMPWVHAHLNVKRDPLSTIIGGYSEGGAAAAFAAMQRPDLFGKVLTQSGSFWEGYQQIKWEFLANQYQDKPKLPLQFFIEAGVLEDVSKDGPTLLAANRRFAEILKSKGYQVTYEEVGGTHEPVHWRDTLSQGLMALLKQ